MSGKDMQGEILKPAGAWSRELGCLAGGHRRSRIPRELWNILVYPGMHSLWAKPGGREKFTFCL